MKIWIDDLRSVPNDTWILAKNSKYSLSLLEWSKMMGVRLEAVSFDHDLGGDDTTRPVILWMCENEWWPKRCYVHSMNPIGRNYLIGMINRYGPGVSNNG
jgi:hypothetical protein